jgi:adenylyltransferase/sulfurtransferase
VSLVKATEYKNLIDKGEPHLLLDVWPAHHFQIVSLSGSLNIPLSVLEEKLPMLEASLNEITDSSATALDKQSWLYLVCRRGNDSQSPVQREGLPLRNPARLKYFILLHLHKYMVPSFT